jgi:hypothetical protein
MSLTAEQHRALAVLRGAGPSGTSQALLMSYGFSVSMIAGLANRGLATLGREKVQAGDRSVKVAKVWITAVGSDALAAEERFNGVSFEGIPPRESGPARNLPGPTQCGNELG